MTGIELVFLGTGGGRFATLTQKRRTGGIRLISESLHMHLDPGPGALIYSLNMKLNPQKVKAVLVSHCHPDHYTDAEIFVEAMTRGMTRRRGILAAPRSVLFGNEVCGPAISKYHQQMPEKVIEIRSGVAFTVDDIKILATEARHTDPDTVGYRLETRDVGDIGYTSDTEYFEGVGKSYKGVRLLLLCVMRPSGEPWKGHMTTEDAVKIVEEAGPEMVVTTHFGMKIIFRGPAREAKMIEEKTGVPVLAASDGMRISVGEEIWVKKARRKQRGLDEFVEPP
ncbi:MBL fold metallo-hydrolase [Candidatus Bathyarchaeota archaeon]|nr:MBL fold metallo-hydrolase [Candidatus Bathyarchaeota archaeon]